MKRTILAVTVATLALAAGVGAAVITASGHDHGTTTPTTKPPATTHPANPEGLQFVSKDSKDSYVDAKPSGLSTGDVLTQHSTWYINDEKVGEMALTATVTLRTSAQTGEVLFTAVGRLKLGDVAMTGTFDIVPQNQTFQAAITGGTGLYAGMRGHAVFDQVSANVTNVTLYLEK
jgi:hypothetical protein